jgi:hypothetical protein
MRLSHVDVAVRGRVFELCCLLLLTWLYLSCNLPIGLHCLWAYCIGCRPLPVVFDSLLDVLTRGARGGIRHHLEELGGQCCLVCYAVETCTRRMVCHKWWVCKVTCCAAC